MTGMMMMMMMMMMVYQVGASGPCHPCVCVADRLVCHSQAPRSWDAIPKTIQHMDMRGVPIQRLSLLDIATMPELLTLDLRGSGRCVIMDGVQVLSDCISTEVYHTTPLPTRKPPRIPKALFLSTITEGRRNIMRHKLTYNQFFQSFSCARHLTKPVKCKKCFHVVNTVVNIYI